VADTRCTYRHLKSGQTVTAIRSPMDPVRPPISHSAKNMKTEIAYNDIDAVLLPWARDHGLHVFTECKDEETRAIVLTDEWGDQYELYSVPDHETQESLVAVGADLVKRTGKAHTFYRERKQYHFRQTGDLTELARLLDRALAKATEWGANYHRSTR
jgi:hypothetical protein